MEMPGYLVQFAVVSIFVPRVLGLAVHQYSCIDVLVYLLVPLLQRCKPRIMWLICSLSE